jgi:hypothetical protein
MIRQGDCLLVSIESLRGRWRHIATPSLAGSMEISRVVIDRYGYERYVK